MTDDWQQAQVARIGNAIRELRGTRSAQWVSEQTAVLGVPVGRSTITDIEIGRRKYVAVHELSVIATALGVTPTTLLTWGSVPDGQVDLLPGRGVDAMIAADWWGGEMMLGILPAAQGLPATDAKATELFTLARDRQRLQRSLMSAATGGHDFGPDPALVPKLRGRLKDTVRRIRELGGFIAGDTSDASG